MKNNTAVIDIEISPEAQKLAKESEGMLKVYENYSIATVPQYTFASDDLKKIKAKAQELDALRRSMTRPLDESKRKIMDFFNHPLNLLIRAEATIKRAMVDFQREQERIRREREEKLRRQAEVEEARKKKALKEKAKKAEEQGKTEKAEELREKAEEVHVPTPIIPTEVPKIAGQQTREIWKARVTNINKLPREYMVANDTMLQQFARATKGKIPIAGVEFYTEQIMATKTK